MKKEKFIRLNDLSMTDRTAIRVKTIAQLRLNRGNVRKTSREAHVAASTIRSWLREDNEVSREVAKERAEIQEQERQLLRSQLNERATMHDLTQAKLVSEQVEKVTALAMDRVTVLANELVESLITDLLTNNNKIRFHDRTMAFAIIFDKIQVYEGNPTSIRANVGRHLSRDERAVRAKQLLETAEQRRLKLKVVNAPPAIDLGGEATE
jgi:hypothetical protein